jgi:hypothetical protein
MLVANETRLIWRTLYWHYSVDLPKMLNTMENIVQVCNQKGWAFCISREANKNCWMVYKSHMLHHLRGLSMLWCCLQTQMKPFQSLESCQHISLLKDCQTRATKCQNEWHWFGIGMIFHVIYIWFVISESTIFLYFCSFSSNGYFACNAMVYMAKVHILKLHTHRNNA